MEIIRYAREKMPGLSITSDVIVGFPGETYEEFQDTLSLIREVGFTALYTFIFPQERERRRQECRTRCPTRKRPGGSRSC